jgi:hypothetical protein
MNGPPKRESRPAGNEAASTTAADDFDHSLTSDLCASQIGRRRRAASRRLPILDSGHADPWRYPEPGVRGYAEAAQHLLSLGLTPTPNVPALQAMSRADGESRRVAQLISERWERAA